MKYFLIVPLKLYQWCVSPLLPPACRYWPSCSQYMLEAVEKRGVLAGVWLGVKRLLRCAPWGGSGYDPVPEKKSRVQSPES